VNARSSSCVKRCDERLALKGGETYSFINQINIVVFAIKIFLKFTAMGAGG